MGSTGFRFETLLHLRKLREQERQRAVATRLAAIHRLEERQATLIRRIDEQTLAARAALRLQAVDLDRLRLGRHWVTRLRRGVLETQAEITTQRAMLAQERQQLTTAATDKKVLERLKAQRLARIAAEQDRRERLEQDEMNVLRFVHAGLSADGDEA
jgi:flagellar export protein FliJ